MAPLCWWLCLIIFVMSFYRYSFADLVPEPLMISPRRTGSTSQSPILQNGAPRSGFSAPPLPGGPNIIHEPCDEEEEEEGEEIRPSVKLRQGIAIGSVVLSRWTRKPIYLFLGIPYAKPPIGELRFKAPEPAGAWSGILDATKHGRTCPVSLGSQSMPEEKYKNYPDNGNEEDCLQINVYSPSISEESGLPVMVYIHSGGFAMQSPREFKPHLLLERDIILVVPHYRVGVLGFLAAGVDSAPGNAGLFDILLALHWIRDNIVSFGGNPGRVTLFGSSSGASVAALMLFSPLVGPALFQRLILQSGSALSPWIIDEYPIHAAHGVAQFANCTRRTIEREIACLKRLVYIDLLKAHSSMLMKSKINQEAILGATTPVIQRVGRQRFLTAHPSELFIRGQFLRKSILAGVVAQEGSFIVGDIYQFFRKEDRDFMQHNFTRMIFKMGGLKDSTGFLGQSLSEKYFNPSIFGNFTLMTKGLIDIASSTLFKSPVFTLTQEMSRSRTCFLYSFNYAGRFSKIDHGHLIDFPFSLGVAHTDELLYLFPHKGMVMSEEEARISRQMVDLWTSFAAKERPMASGVPRWNPISTEKGPYMRIDNNFSEKKNFYNEYRVTVDEGLPHGPFYQID